jgi:hypothetical protein
MKKAALTSIRPDPAATAFRPSIEAATAKLMKLAGDSYSEPVRHFLRRAYGHLEDQLAAIDDVILNQ